MFAMHHKPISTGIVFRLRLVFFVIVLVLFSTVLVGVTQLRKLTNSVDDLTISSVSVFVKTEKTSRLLAKLLILLQSSDSVEDIDKLQKISNDVTTTLETLKLNTPELIRDRKLSSSTAQILEALYSIEENAFDLLQSRANIIQTHEKIIQQIENLTIHRKIVIEILEEFSNSNAEYSDDILSSYDSFQSTNNIIQLYHQNLRNSAAITALTLGLESVFDTATHLQNLPSTVAIEETRAALQHKINGMTVLIAQIPKTEKRAELAKQLIQIRSILFGLNGLLEQTSHLQSIRQQYAQEAINNYSPINTISELSDSITDQADQKIDENRKHVFEVMTNMTTGITAFVGFALFIIGIALFYIVERQINRRMAKLTLAVQKLASGDTAHIGGVSGQDELGEIAKALEVFKNNAEELQRSNTELEKFAYVAAHDLRSPLRAIQDLAEWTIEDPENKFSPEGALNMSLLKSRIHRLSRLLSDLLEYSRVGKEEDDIALVSVAKTVAELSELLDPNNEYNISFSGDANPVLTYSTPLRQVLLNLLSNAIKHHDQASGQISVESNIVAEHIVVKIHDDGPGILPKYHDRIFDLFQTLRPRDEVEGSGLGLAIIRKLLEHYGCSIRVHSDPSQRRGTLFVFSLPELSLDSATENLAA